MPLPNPLSQSPSVRFGLRFALVFAGLLGALEALRTSSLWPALLQSALLQPTAALLSLGLSPDTVYSQGISLISGSTRLNVVRGCDGTETLLLLISALFAYPASARERTVGLVCGSVVTYLLSVLRLSALFLTLRYSPQAWEALHGLVLPLTPVLGVALYFLHWSGTTSACDPAPPSC